MPEPLTPDQVAGELVDDAVDAWHEMQRPLALDDQMRHILAPVLTKFDDASRAEIVKWIEAQMVKCPHGHDRDTGHKALCNWCWQNAALIGAARLARGDHGSTRGLVLYRMEQEAAHG